MAKSHLFLSILIFFFIIIIIPLICGTPTNTSKLSLAHTQLIKYGFPIGLLPTNVHSYTINTTTGDFCVVLNHNCRVTLPPDNYLATYSKKITGKIVENKINELNGINVKAFFRWWGITAIKNNGKDLTFEVGMLSAKYPADKFGDSPACEGKHSSS
ncbi:uncharacterized protein LOC141660481 [Apium graveolens]|uniref:uncharacterized protein LOC141660481 n=1 Tax=Apium graveolens TaxID=4045 RepID=UPI003D7B3646